jgi:hypothetical protein
VAGSVVSSGIAPPVGTTITSTASCPAGKVLLGGGFSLGGALLAVTATPTDSHPTSTTTWSASATNYATAAVSFTIQAYAVCSA